MTPETATQLLCKVGKDQDQQAFNLLFAEFAPRIKSYMMREGAEAAAADDVAQEAFTNIWRKAHLYDPSKGSAPTWMFRIARNLRIDRFRKERVWQPLPEEHLELASEEPSPDDVVDQNAQYEALRVALDELSPEQREVIELAYLGGLSQSQVSERLGVPLGTVKSRMRLAYEKLQPLLEKYR